MFPELAAAINVSEEEMALPSRSHSFSPLAAVDEIAFECVGLTGHESAVCNGIDNSGMRVTTHELVTISGIACRRRQGWSRIAHGSQVDRP